MNGVRTVVYECHSCGVWQRLAMTFGGIPTCTCGKLMELNFRYLPELSDKPPISEGKGFGHEKNYKRKTVAGTGKPRKDPTCTQHEKRKAEAQERRTAGETRGRKGKCSS